MSPQPYGSKKERRGQFTTARSRKQRLVIQAPDDVLRRLNELERRNRDLEGEVRALQLQSSRFYDDPNAQEDGPIHDEEDVAGTEDGLHAFPRIFDIIVLGGYEVRITGRGRTVIPWWNNLLITTWEVDTNPNFTVIWWPSGEYWQIYSAATGRWSTAYIYIRISRDPSGGLIARLGADSTLPSVSGDERLYPLWYIPDAGSPETINAAGIIDLRDSCLMEGEWPHPWHFALTSPTGGTVTQGKVYFKGNNVYTLPVNTNLTGITTSQFAWVKLDRYLLTADWGMGATVPANTDTEEYIVVLEFQCSGGQIVNVIERWQCDIHETLFA